MHKEIEKAVIKITQAMEKNRNAYNDADASYRDTGHNRYWNKMQKLDAEYEELKLFLHPKEDTGADAETILKFEELRRNVKNLRSKWRYLRADLPDSVDSVGIDDIFREIRPLLD